jgi:hypothetical protein
MSMQKPVILQHETLRRLRKSYEHRGGAYLLNIIDYFILPSAMGINATRHV